MNLKLWQPSILPWHIWSDSGAHNIDQFSSQYKDFEMHVSCCIETSSAYHIDMAPCLWCSQDLNVLFGGNSGFCAYMWAHRASRHHYQEQVFASICSQNFCSWCSSGFTNCSLVMNLNKLLMQLVEVHRMQKVGVETPTFSSWENCQKSGSRLLSAGQLFGSETAILLFSYLKRLSWAVRDCPRDWALRQFSPCNLIL